MKTIARVLIGFLIAVISAAGFAQAVDHLTISAASAWGGTDQPYVYVYLASAASGTRSVTLTSSDPAACSVPASINIGAGSTYNYFYVSTHAVDADKDVTITAEGKTIHLLVKANQPDRMTISTDQLWGGTDGPYIYVYLKGPAKTGGQVVNLTSSNPALASVPATVNIGAGSTYNYFYIQSLEISESTLCSVFATCNGGTAQIDFIVWANWPDHVTTSDASLWGGWGSPYCYVYLSGPAHSPNTAVQLASSDPAALQVPASMSISGGSSYNYFYYTTAAVAKDKVVRITATHLGGSAYVDVLVKASPPDHWARPNWAVIGGNTDYDYVYLRGLAPSGGATIALTSTEPAVLKPPASFLIGGGNGSNYYYYNTFAVTRAHYVDVTASYLGNSITNTIAVLPTGNTTLSGRVTFGGLSDMANAPATVHLEYREPGTQTVFGSADATVYVDGAYSVPRPRTTPFDISVKTGTWLRRTIKVGSTSTLATFAHLNLINGDIDNDNSITVFDYSVLSDYFDKTSADSDWNTVGGNGSKPSDADLDRDGAITVFDYSILSDNFDMNGDE